MKLIIALTLLVATCSAQTLTCTPASLGPSASTTCTLKVAAQLTAETTYGLLGTNPSLTFPATVTTAQGATSTTFTAKTAAVILSAGTATIVAVVNGAAVSCNILLVQPTPAPATNYADNETAQLVATATQPIYTLAHTPIINSTHCYANGIRQLLGDTYWVTGSSILVLSQSPTDPIYSWYSAYGYTPALPTDQVVCDYRY